MNIIYEINEKVNKCWLPYIKKSFRIVCGKNFDKVFIETVNWNFVFLDYITNVILFSKN